MNKAISKKEMYTPKQVADILGIKVPNVYATGKRLGISNTTDYTEEQLQLMKDHCFKYQKSLGFKSIPDIAKDTGLSRQYIYKYAVTHGYIKKGNSNNNLLSIHDASELLKEIQRA